MATILLQAAGGIVGGLIGGPFGAMAGRALGALGGYAVDSMLFSKTGRAEAGRLTASRIMEADEGAGIPRLFGTARIAGQVIWTTRFEETSTSERQGGKGGSGGGTVVTSYSYFGNVAIGLSEGPIAGIRRVWADGEELDLSGVTWRLYRGDEEQMPDPLIESRQGRGNTPAYRGLAYLVFERLPLESWGNRIPQISVEVIRSVGQLEGNLRAVALLPGATEHGLDPQPVRETLSAGEDRVVNRAILYGETDIEASLDELQALAPELSRVALVVSWFGTDLRAGECRIMPGVEVRQRDETEKWCAGGVSRAGAYLVSRAGGGAAFGGTPSDAGVMRAIREIKARGLKVTHYPFLLMDIRAGNGLPDPYGDGEQAAYPWRGRITLDIEVGRPGSPDGTAAADAAITAFVGTAKPSDFLISGASVTYRGPAEWSYRRMVLHQAHLAKAAGGVAAFVIGSELRGLTRVRGAAGTFPFVDALVRLAADVKSILPGTIVTYAADWSEYSGYRPQDGSGDLFYNLDSLWASPAIDVVGIDNYLPAADWRATDWADGGPDAIASPYDRDGIKWHIRGGEDYDWYYASEADRNGRIRTPITDGAAGKPWVWRAKDIWSWWANAHIERQGGHEVGGRSPWVPMGKPVWFTELGCPAVDKGANQPNVFVDPKSAESGLPHFSSGASDPAIQRRFLEAQLSFWNPEAEGFIEANNPVSPIYGGRMVEPDGIHVWAWDARPYPAFPERMDLWSDGANWLRGHWLTGRLGRAPLDGLIAGLLTAHGFSDFDVSAVDGEVGGYVIDGPVSARSALEELLSLTGVVACPTGQGLIFRSLRRWQPEVVLSTFVDEKDGPLVEYRRAQADEMPQELIVGYSDPSRAYQTAAAEAGLACGDGLRQETVQLPVTLAEHEARAFAAAGLASRLGARETALLAVSPAELAIESGDAAILDGRTGDWLVTRIEAGASRRIELRLLPDRVGEEPDFAGVSTAPVARAPVVASRPLVHFLDLPLGSNGEAGSAPRLAVYAKPFVPYLVESSATGEGYAARFVASRPATIGILAQTLGAGPEGLIDHGNQIVVDLKRGALFSVTRAALLAGSNLAAILCGNGDWEVLQFEAAEEVAPMRFLLRGLLRAQGGTEDAMAAGAAAGNPFVLLDEATSSLQLRPGEIGGENHWRISPTGRPLDPATRVEAVAALGLRAMRPLSPVHLRATFETDGGLALAWVRRTRTDGDRWDGIEVPLGETGELYRITLAGEDGRSLVLESTTPMVTVGAASQLEAFGRLPPRLSASVCQVSMEFGAGTAREAWFERAA
ncbi:baseplate multidomain protein megatron [Consotaella salsifontis]|uniref:Putative phage tail protein n=1 Tax=Consotaella salsifontis TaxID=1365950 RepID=A0A1T4MCS5_9HYPH|nr:glycoside hydrolase/phage tail family protein [Consotaella salsifontis]SJZ64829.1 Putative phage tail protein [Consotaella salsifontis]